MSLSNLFLSLKIQIYLIYLIPLVIKVDFPLNFHINLNVIFMYQKGILVN